MKTFRTLGVALLATSTLVLGACGDDDDDNGTGPANTATVRFVNATGQNLDVGMGGTFGATNSNVGFGQGTSCMQVNTATPALSFRQNGQASTFNLAGFTPNFTTGGNYTVIITGTPGNYSARTLTDTYQGATATAGGVRVVNATSGTTNYGLYLGNSGTMPASATNATFGSGLFTGFLPVNAGQGQVWLTTGTGASQQTVFTGTPFAVTANTYQTVVITDAATGQPARALRSFIVNRCS